MKVRRWTLDDKEIAALRVLSDVYHGPCDVIDHCEDCPFYSFGDRCVPEAASNLMAKLSLDRGLD